MKGETKMAVAIVICFDWIIINGFMMMPKRLDRETFLFLFLLSSLTIMLSMIYSAGELYFSPTYRDFPMQDAVAFHMNRNITFPMLTLVALNLWKSGQLWEKLLSCLGSYVIFLLFCRIDPVHTTFKSIGISGLTTYFSCYYLFVLVALSLFTKGNKKRSIHQRSSQ
ncbi:hypothetical protein C0674_07740 [Sporolactobacillus terrae]|uniref:Uncharacterized protein n=2 Tax=Sporolactobacillus terrae TaxID=269673 RepID=A0ABX5Q7B9_9BACL|nr:hypothetical protein C0674_07740 [Sporolactobacillus terrae]QAA25499.1 hypothetical protein C0679_07720 [Sporolactobacillus terrae]